MKDVYEEIESQIFLTSILLETCDYYKIPLIASPLFNFRDALAHYVQYYEAEKAKVHDKMLAEEASIKEHAFRGTKDACVYILRKMKQRVLDVFINVKNTNEKRRAFRKLLHKYKNLELEIRKNTEATLTRGLVPSIMELTDLIEETKKDFERHGEDFPTKRSRPMSTDLVHP